MKKILRRNIGKRGISPIVATIILVGFVVIIIVLIWLWSSSVYRENVEKESVIAQEQLNCNEVDIEAEKPGGTIYIRNTGSRTIKGFVLREELGGSVRISNVYTEVMVGETFPLTQSSIECGPGSAEPDTPGALCGNTNGVVVTPALQPIGRGAPLVQCVNAHISLTP